MTKEIQKSSSKYIAPICFVAIAPALYWFWAFPYRAALGYREEMQLFQTTAAYLDSLAGRPAGISVYIGEFLTQTFNNFWIGAAVMSAMLLLLLYLTLTVVRRFYPDIKPSVALLISLLPFAALWLFLGNPDVTLGFVVALIMAVGAVAAFVSSYPDNGIAGRYLHMLALTAFLYWLAGPLAVIFTLLVIFYVGKDPSASLTHKVFFSSLALIWLAVNFFMWMPSLPYSAAYQLIGIGFLLRPDVLEAGQVIVVGLCVFLPVIALIAMRLPRKITVPTLAGLIVAGAAIFFPRCYDTDTYRLIDYDYMVRSNDWDGILRYSDRHDPDSRLGVSATNLALGMTGQLDARAFDYFQHGSEGLIPSFMKEPLSSWTTGEILFQLGMVNSAQRFYFEGMEAIPNYNKSARVVKRLAETAMIRGEYRLAGKYLSMLENTTFYRKWARRNLELINNPQTIDAHPLYGTLRNRTIDEDYLFSEGEIDRTLGNLFAKDPSNVLARQYLIVYPLLERNLDKFGRYMGSVVGSDPGYNPPLAQQALAFMAMKNGQPIPQGAVSPAVEQSLRGFAQAWTSKNPELIAPYRRTLFHYLISDK